MRGQRRRYPNCEVPGAQATSLVLGTREDQTNRSGNISPLVAAIAPGAVITTEELGRAMIRAARKGAPRRVLEMRDLRALGAP